MKIKTIIVGPLQTNCYILTNGNDAIIVDPGDEAIKIEKELGNLNLKGILLTHNHFDHVGALSYFENKYNLKHNDKIKEFNYETIKTPGHTSDSITFYFKEENVMFVGDFIFKNGIGRMDLGGNVEDMKNSLKKISQYPNNMVLYPGHGDKTTLKEEINNFSYYIN